MLFSERLVTVLICCNLVAYLSLPRLSSWKPLVFNWNLWVWMCKLRWLIFLFLPFFKMFIDWFREKERSREGQKGGERESKADSRLSAQSPVWGSNHEIMTWVDTESWMLSRLSQLGALLLLPFYSSVDSEVFADLVKCGVELYTFFSVLKKCL